MTNAVLDIDGPHRRSSLMNILKENESNAENIENGENNRV